MEALEEAGHHVWALEPAQVGFEACQKRMKNPHQAFQLSHEELIAVLNDSTHPLNQNPFDAVMVGWGSLTHCFGADNRSRLLKALKQLCPSGSILSSFWGHQGESQKNVPLRFRAQNQLGKLVGSLLGTLRNPEEIEILPIIMTGHLGPGIGMGEPELKRLAAEIQSDVAIFLNSPQPYAIFESRESNA